MINNSADCLCIRVCWLDIFLREAFDVFWTVSAICDRRNERERSAAVCGSRQRMERAENAESVIGRVGTVPILGAREWVRRLRLSPTKRKYRLGDAGCFAFPFEERSDEVSLPDPAPKS